jgi:hypothetical protein
LPQNVSIAYLSDLKKVQQMLSKLQFKEWFDRYKYAELAATTTALLCSQLSRFFNPLSTAYLITFAEFCFLCCDCNHQLPPISRTK